MIYYRKISVWKYAISDKIINIITNVIENLRVEYIVTQLLEEEKQNKQKRYLQEGTHTRHRNFL